MTPTLAVSVTPQLLNAFVSIDASADSPQCRDLPAAISRASKGMARESYTHAAHDVPDQCCPVFSIRESKGLWNVVRIHFESRSEVHFWHHKTVVVGGQVTTG